MTLNTFDPAGSEALVVQRLLGSAYETVKFVVQNFETLRTIASQMEAVVALQGAAPAIAALGAALTELETLYESLEQVLAVHAEINDINAIGTNIAALLAVQASLPAVIGVNASLVEIAQIYPHVGAIGQVQSIMPDITNVSTNMATLTYISENIAGLISGLQGVNSVMDARRATQAEAETGTSHDVFSTPLRVAQQIWARIGTTAGTIAAGNDTRITGAAQKSANLNDLADKAAARSNLGLGNSVTRDVGSVAGTVAAGDDPRFTPTIPFATNSEAVAGAAADKVMSPLRTKEAIASKFDKTGGAISGSTSITGNLAVSGEISTPALGELGSRIESRASAYAAAAQAAAANYTESRAAAYASGAHTTAINSANATALAYANQRLSALALGANWSGTSRPAGGVIANVYMQNQGDGIYSLYTEGKYIYGFIPSTGWVVAGDI